MSMSSRKLSVRVIHGVIQVRGLVNVVDVVDVAGLLGIAFNLGFSK